MASLRFQRVGKRFPDGTLALSDVSLSIADGEFVVLVGPSGCGKSTLLRSAAGLEDLSTGRVFIGERDVTDQDPQDRDVAMVFQSYALYPHMTVFDNMAFGLQQRRMAKTEITRRVRQAAATLHLSELLHRKPGALSGGQRQRVAMGRAIVRDPAAFLMDEPLSNLDAKLRVQMRAELKLLNAQLGVTTLYVTHDQVEAMTMGDRVAVLGPAVSDATTNLQQVATPAVLYDQPDNLFVAGFIGSPPMNLVPATLVPLGDGLAAQLGDSAIRLPVPAAQMQRRPELRGFAGSGVVLGIRPEFFGMGVPPAPACAPLQVTVLITEMTGSDAYLHFDVPVPAFARVPTADDLEPIDQNRVIARIDPRQVPARGAGVALWIDMDRVHMFDPLTTRAIR